MCMSACLCDGELPQEYLDLAPNSQRALSSVIISFTTHLDNNIAEL